MESKIEMPIHLFDRDGLAFYKDETHIMIAHGYGPSCVDYNIVLPKNEVLLLFIAYINGMPLPTIPGLRAELDDGGDSLKLLQKKRRSWIGPDAAVDVVADLLGSTDA